jgi:hypothetical protein
MSEVIRTLSAEYRELASQLEEAERTGQPVIALERQVAKVRDELAIVRWLCGCQ